MHFSSQSWTQFPTRQIIHWYTHPVLRRMSSRPISAPLLSWDKIRILATQHNMTREACSNITNSSHLRFSWGKHLRLLYWLQVDGYDSAGTCHVGCVECNKFIEDCSVRASKESGWEEDSVEMDIELMLNSTQLLAWGSPCIDSFLQ